MRFKAGQLVSTLDWLSDALELYNVPPEKGDGHERAVGSLGPGSIALVVALDRADGACVYVLGPSGGGWTTGGLLRVVQG